MKQKNSIKNEIRETEGEEFSYDGDIGSIGAVATGDSSAKIEHFVIRKDDRRNGYGSRLFESMLDVLRENNYRFVKVEIQSLSEDGEDDPVMGFLDQYGFRYEKSFDHHNWGDCIVATGHI